MRMGKSGERVLSMMSVAAALLLSTTAIDLYFLTANYDPVNLSAAIRSIPFFEAVKADVSIKEYLIMYQCMAVLGYAVCWGTSILIGASAKTSRKSLAVLILTLFLPYLTSVLGTEVFAWVNYARITAPAIVASAVPTLICISAAAVYLVIRNKRYFGR